MTRFRRVFFWVHLVAGAAAGVVILVLSATGAALALKPQILRAVDTAGFSIAADGRQPLSASALIDAIHQSNPDADVRSVTLQRDANAPASAQVDTATTYLDPYSGEVLGQSSQRAQQVFRSIEDWHRWFALQGDSRQTGRAITGAANATFLFLAVTGLYLWMPRQWTLRHLRPIAFFRRASTPKARDFNWHNVAGVWSLPMIVVMTLTGVFMSYPSLNGQLQQALGGLGNERPGGPGEPGGPGGPGRPSPEFAPGRSISGPSAPVSAGVRSSGGHATPAVHVDSAMIDAAMTDLRSREPDWQTISVEMPRTADGSLTVSASTGGSTPSARSQLVVSAKTAEVLRWQPATTTVPLAQRVRMWIRFGHTGELWGVTGQILAGLSCLGGVLLVWTGLSLAARRLAAFMRRSGANRRAAIASRHDSRPTVPMSGYAATVIREEA